MIFITWLKQKFKQFLQKKEGVVAIEYALIASMISIGIIVSLTWTRDELVRTFDTIAFALQDANQRYDSNFTYNRFSNRNIFINRSSRRF